MYVLFINIITLITIITIIRLHHEQNELFVYGGHGGGEVVCDARRLRRVRCPSAWLWGCSSGRLVCRGVHDPWGVALSYLLSAGDSTNNNSNDNKRRCEHVLGSLWDVTDKDIDKLSLQFMTVALPSSSNDSNMTSSVPVNVALVNAREVCKMKYAVGCAPVIYGLPSALI